MSEFMLCRVSFYKTSEKKPSTDFAYLHEEDVSCGVSASVYNKCLLLDVTAAAGADGQLAAVLDIQFSTNYHKG